MKNESTDYVNLSNPLERVKELFLRGKQLKSPQNPPSKGFNSVKIPRIPRPHPQQKADKRKQKFAISSLKLQDLQDAALNTHKCCAHQKDFLHLAASSLEMNFLLGRVKTWRYKECLLAFRNLKKMHKERESGKNHRVTLIPQTKDSQQQEDRKKLELWQELIKLNEERHFHLTRITKILS